jgi:hypothetical protein
LLSDNYLLKQSDCFRYPTDLMIDDRKIHSCPNYATLISHRVPQSHGSLELFDGKVELADLEVRRCEVVRHHRDSAWIAGSLRGSEAMTLCLQ